jgi:Calx-beta domain
VARALFLSLLLAASLAVSAAPFQFDAAGVTAVVTPTATTYWMCVCLGTSLGDPLIAHLYAVVTDTDGDGVVRWELGTNMQPGGLWTMIDGTAGTIATQNRLSVPVEPRPFPRKAFQRDETGAYSRFVVNHADLPWVYDMYLFWVRPGVGAWTWNVYDQGSRDEIPIDNKKVMVNLPLMSPVGASPGAPSGVEAGDFLVWMQEEAEFWTGVRVDQQHLDDTIGPGRIFFAKASGHEDTGKIEVQLARVEGTDGAASVHYQTSDDTARAGVHYVATSGTVQFDPGEIFQTIEVPLIDDRVDAQSARFRLTLSDPSGAALGTPASTTVPIPDNDGTPRVTIESLVIDEDGDTGEHEVPVKVTLDHTAPKPVTIEWKATDRFTFETVATGVLEFAVGEKQKAIVLRYVADDVYGGHSIRIVMTNVVNATRIGEGRLTIVEDDPEPVMTLLGTTVTEGAGTAIVTVNFSAPFTREIGWLWQTEDGDASSPHDYTSIPPGYAWLPAGSTSMTLAIPIHDDNVREGTESFRVVMPVHEISVTVTILDNEPSTRRRTVRH